MKVSDGETTAYAYDAMGLLAAVYSTNPPLQPGTLYLTADNLGSTRLVTNAAGSVVACHDYLPFGEEILGGYGGRGSCVGAADGIAQKFTGKERDAELASSAMQGLDFFESRYFSGAQGRFASADEPLADQSPNDPQCWNLYPYARNNPLSFIDPAGRECVTLDGGGVGDNGVGKPCRDKSLTTTHGVTVNGRTGAVTSGVFYNAVLMGDIDLSGRKDRIIGQTAEIVNNLTSVKAVATLAKVGVALGPLVFAMAKLRPAERLIVEELVAAGKTVEVIPTAEGPTADFLVDGVPTELKTLTSSGPTTLKNAVQNAAKQGEQILIDARNVNITPQEALGQIQRAQGNVGGLQGRVTVLTKSGTVTF
jgi:RHS repeat-associated protein